MSQSGKIKSEGDTVSDNEEEEEELRFIAMPALKSRDKEGIILKHRRQKFCPRWEDSFPWLKPDNVDESIGFCTICSKKLVCKKSHLERHERSYKHREGVNSSTGSAANKNVVAERLEDEDSQTTMSEFLECTKQEPHFDELSSTIELDPEYCIEMDAIEPTASMENKAVEIKQHNVKPSVPTKSVRSNNNNNTKLNHFKLLKVIERSRNELNDLYRARQKSEKPTSVRSSPVPLVQAPTVAPPRDHMDLFFDSVSASVKTFPPKLATEVKSRVSQMIAEFEYRAICEREMKAAENVNNSNIILNGNTMMVTTTTATTGNMAPASNLPVAPTNYTDTGTIVSSAEPQFIYTIEAGMPRN